MEGKEQKTSTKMEPLPPSQNRGFLTSNAPAYNLLDHPEFYMLGKMVYKLISRNVPMNLYQMLLHNKQMIGTYCLDDEGQKILGVLRFKEAV